MTRVTDELQRVEVPVNPTPFEGNGFKPTVYWYPSFRCNLSCRHCWVNSSPGVDTSADLSTDELLEVADQIIDFGAGRVIMSGGEALYRPDAITVIRKLVRADIRVSFETNGLLFTPKFVELAREALFRGVPLGVAISLDGGTAEAHNFLRGKGTFERTVAGMDALFAENLPFYVQCVVNPKNVSSIQAFVERMQGYWPVVRQIQFAFLSRVGRGLRLSNKYAMTAETRRQAYSEIARVKRTFKGRVIVKVPPALFPQEHLMELFYGSKQTSCSTSCAFPTLGILNDGTISICAITRDNPAVNFGSVKTHRLLDVWRTARLDLMRKKYVEASELSGICGSCVFRRECKGSCRAHAYEESGDFNAPHPLCAEMEANGEFPEAYRDRRRPVNALKRVPVASLPA